MGLLEALFHINSNVFHFGYVGLSRVGFSREKRNDLHFTYPSIRPFDSQINH